MKEIDTGKVWTVFLVDDHAILREGLSLIFSSHSNYRVIEEAGSFTEAVPKIQETKPDLCVLDISLPDRSGLELAKELKSKNFPGKIILLSRHDQWEYIREAKRIGVHAYVLKDEAAKDLLLAADYVREGRYYLSPRLRESGSGSGMGPVEWTHDQKPNQSELVKLLTEREREVLYWIGEGLGNPEIAKKLLIQPKTVKIHRQNIMDKLEIHKASELVLFASRAFIDGHKES
jgi:DNA-binding NarL/FixJ family response regulator